MRISDSGLKLIENFEGLELTAYRDSVGILTIGYGHTTGVYKGQVITQFQAESFLKTDIVHAEFAVQKFCKKTLLSQNEFDALVSLVFNIGNQAFKTSTLLKLLNNGTDRKIVANEFDKWIHGGHHVIAGLVTRREKEKELFLQK